MAVEVLGELLTGLLEVLVELVSWWPTRKARERRKRIRERREQRRQARLRRRRSEGRA